MKRLENFFKLVLGILRELGDENAYQRHLALSDRKDSRQEWQRFHRVRLQTKYQRAKCC
jgi:hypothetical protein